MIDSLEAERFSALGDRPICFLDLGSPDAMEQARLLSRVTQAAVVGLDPEGALPGVDESLFDLLMTSAVDAPRPWVTVAAAHWRDRIEAMTALASRHPVATTIAMRLMRMQADMGFEDAVHAESLAYSTLLGGAEFRQWLSERKTEPRTVVAAPFIEMERSDDHVTVRLARPDNRNALCAGMRDALFEALAAVADDPTQPALWLEGAGPCFSTGGDLPEFGSASDLAMAHVIRTMRSCAVMLHRIGDRATVVLHGACVGSGIEVPAAAARRIARPGTFFHLPELRMGLIPGAGGTVTLTRAIGRHRTAYMLLSARRIDLATALDWGLVHAVDAAT
ncbi:enoyl-CoA hydratase/isomerase family protein [Sphingobium sp. Sx8-8]|uniref:enoyl-CoA hydratase/isomerase family protein n=1 Tax=Sphingobium sp. Sx8-8 TaxID=2933617 RepID=UPI001F5601DD|nr:enoyl-CoA hydratase/isomerase family protein [Sphingobium sp. Sx8-8]